MPDPPKKKKLFGTPGSGPVTQEVLKERRRAAGEAPTSYSVGTYSSKGQYTGAPPPRVGGKARKSIGVPQGAYKRSAVKQAIRRIKKTKASPQAKKAARRAYR
jgi:hypothetical protein